MSEPPPAPGIPPAPKPTAAFSDILRADWAEAAGRPLLALVFVWLLGLVPALLIWAWGGPGGLLRTPALGWGYVALFHAVPLVGSGASQILQAFGLGGSLRLVFFACPMLGTLAALTLCFHAGRGLARTSMVRVDGRASPIAFVNAGRIALVYALAFLAVSALARSTFSYGSALTTSTVSVHAEIVRSFVAPFVLAFGAALAGGYTAVRLRAGGSVRAVAACVTGGAAALAAAIAIGIGGWVVVALANPDGTTTYARWVVDRGPAGAAAVLANQGLALPNHGMLVLAPAMGVCDRVSIAGGSRDVVCLRHVAADPGSALAATGGVGSAQIPQRPAPGWFLVFLLIPAVGCSLGGAASARALRRGEGASSLRAAALVGAGSGVVFAAFVGVAAVLVSVRLEAAYSGTSSAYGISFGPDPSLTALVGLAWGVVFCTGGAIATAMRLNRRNPEREGQPVPNRPGAPGAEPTEP